MRRQFRPRKLHFEFLKQFEQFRQYFNHRQLNWLLIESKFLELKERYLKEQIGYQKSILSKGLQ
jgi:hypothetical protein